MIGIMYAPFFHHLLNTLNVFLGKYILVIIISFKSAHRTLRAAYWLAIKVSMLSNFELK